MGCNCGKGKSQKAVEQNPQIVNPGIVANMTKVVQEQPDKIKWFKDGITGLFKCITGDTKYTDAEIIINREACRTCEYSTKVDGKLTKKSQCMAPNPENNNAPCGCFILCKTQTGPCPLNKFVNLTISKP